VQADPFRPCIEFVDISEGTAPVSALGKITGEFGPNVIFRPPLFGYPEAGRHADRESQRNPCKVPIIAVIEGERPEEMADLFRLGVADFVTPPLKSIDVLPRLWRLLGQKRQQRDAHRHPQEKLAMKHMRHLVGECPTFIAESGRFPP